MKIECTNIDINPKDVLDNMTPFEIMDYLKKEHGKWLAMQEKPAEKKNFYELHQWFIIPNCPDDAYCLTSFDGFAILMSYNKKYGRMNRWNDCRMKLDVDKVTHSDFVRSTSKPLGYFKPVDYKDIP